MVPPGRASEGTRHAGPALLSLLVADTRAALAALAFHRLALARAADAAARVRGPLVVLLQQLVRNAFQQLLRREASVGGGY